MTSPDLKVASPDDFDITIIASSDFGELQGELAELVSSGKVKYYDCDADPSVLEKTGLTRDEVTEPVVIVSLKGAAQGESCVVSAVGKSVIVHCEDQVIPLR